MKLLFKQRMFSWFDSYDIYDENGGTVYTVEGKMGWGHRLHILDQGGNHIATVKQKAVSFLAPKYELYLGEEKFGILSRSVFTFLGASYAIDSNGWQVKGNFMEWDYNINDANGIPVAQVRKELMNWTDTYTIDVINPDDALLCLMVVLGIDAEKDSRD